MIFTFRRLVKKAFNSMGLDLIRLPKQDKLLGLKEICFRSIIDIGANRGQFARKIRRIFPEAQIYCFEPLTEPFKALEEWAQTQDGKVLVFNLALGQEQEAVEMHRHLKHNSSSSLLRTTRACEEIFPFIKDQDVVSVDLRQLDKVVEGFAGPLLAETLIKVDTQGYEDCVIRGGLKTFARAKACILEINLDQLYEEQATFKDIFFLLDKIGYRYLGNLNQVYADDGHVVFIDAVFMR